MTLLVAFIFAGLSVRACRDMPELYVVVVAASLVVGGALFAMGGVP